MLYCQSCQQVVVRGSSQCMNCKNGFVSQLVCGECGRHVARGLNACQGCDGRGPSRRPQVSSQEIARSPSLPLEASDLSLPFLPSLPSLPARMLMNDPVPEGYAVQRFGVQAEVQLGGIDADVMTKMKQSAALLYVLADEMNNFQGHMESTRKLMKACRNLAADLQEEIEIRLGPRGSR